MRTLPHVTFFFDSKDYFNNGLDSVSSVNNFKDKGFGMVSGKPFDNGKFRAPSLRNVELTAPYMHDGRFKTLEDVATPSVKPVFATARVARIGARRAGRIRDEFCQTQ